MNSDVLEKVLTCQKLPTLPAVAARVLDLTRDQNVSFRELAAAITSDVALTSKLLKTVNSSFYALRKPCGSINQAIVMLGLSAVKTLALGFSLVSSVAKVKADGFDLQAYWRRSLVSGIAAKCVAVEVRCGGDEECFLGGLLQDVGMIALFVTFQEEYARVVRQTQGDHHQLARHELRDLGTSHIAIGSLLASRWNLPSELIMPIKYHEKPTAAPQEYVRTVQAVALGAIVADLLSAAEPGPVLKRLHTRGEEWLALRPAQCEEIVERTTAATRQIASLFEVDPGKLPSAKELLERANEQLRTIGLPLDDSQKAGGRGASDHEIDRATGLPGRMGMNRTVVAAFEQARTSELPLSVALLAIDQHQELALRGGRFLDAALRHVADVLRKDLSGIGAILCRFDEYRVGMILPGVDRVKAAAALETARAAVARGAASDELAHPLTLSAGLATLDATSRARIVDASTLISLTEQALLAAQRAGPGVLRIFAPRKAA